MLPTLLLPWAGALLLHGARPCVFATRPAPRAAARAIAAPRDTTAAADTAIAIARGLQQKLDDEWIEQEDHERVAGYAAATYTAARADGIDEMSRLLAHIGGELEAYDLGELFVGPWDVANLTIDIVMRENGTDVPCGCG